LESKSLKAGFAEVKGGMEELRIVRDVEEGGCNMKLCSLVLSVASQSL